MCTGSLSELQAPQVAVIMSMLPSLGRNSQNSKKQKPRVTAKMTGMALLTASHFGNREMVLHKCEYGFSPLFMERLHSAVPKDSCCCSVWRPHGAGNPSWASVVQSEHIEHWSLSCVGTGCDIRKRAVQVFVQVSSNSCLGGYGVCLDTGLSPCQFTP